MKFWPFIVALLQGLSPYVAMHSCSEKPSQKYLLGCFYCLFFFPPSLDSEYFLEDAVEMLHFIPPPQEKKKKKPQGERDAYEAEEDVSKPLLVTRGSFYE
jgi:hypothetical protein